MVLKYLVRGRCSPYLVLVENEDVSGGKVAMNERASLQVAHSIAHLTREVAQSIDAEVCANRRVSKTVEY